jgi:recombination protein RecT
MMGQVANIIEMLPALKDKFNTQNSFNLKFESECLFAKQLIQKSDFTLKTAQNNTNSVRSAVLNVAAVGISLNPALAHAYLVPRDGAIQLDISYKGLVKLATDSGAIEWAKAVLVYENDDFEMNGVWEPPNHKYNPFSKDRGELVGGYCLAKLSTGEHMVDVMTFEELEKVRQTSKANNGPWKTWPDEMRKKTLVKRASKSWPQSNGRERLDTAISVINQHEGMEDTQVVSTSDYLQASPEQKQKFLELTKGEPLALYMWWNPLDERIKLSVMDHEFERGQKGRTQAIWRELIAKGREIEQQISADLLACCEAEDEMGVTELLEDLTQDQRETFIEGLPLEAHHFAKGIELAA